VAKPSGCAPSDPDANRRRGQARTVCRSGHRQWVGVLVIESAAAVLVLDRHRRRHRPRRCATWATPPGSARSLGHLGLGSAVGGLIYTGALHRPDPGPGVCSPALAAADRSPLRSRAPEAGAATSALLLIRPAGAVLRPDDHRHRVDCAVPGRARPRPAATALGLNTVRSMTVVRPAVGASAVPARPLTTAAGMRAGFLLAPRWSDLVGSTGTVAALAPAASGGRLCRRRPSPRSDPPGSRFPTLVIL